MIERLRRYVRARRARAAQAGGPARQPDGRDSEETQRRLEDARQRLKQTVPPPEDSAAGGADAESEGRT